MINVTKTRSSRIKGSPRNGSDMTKDGAQLLGFGIVISVAIFFVYWLFAWNNSITDIVLIKGVDISQITWINILIDPVAQGAAYLYNASLFFWTIGILSIVIFLCCLVSAIIMMIMK